MFYLPSIKIMPFNRLWAAGIGVLILAFWLRVDVHRNVFLPRNIDLLTVETRDLANGLHNGSITSVQLIREYLRRIKLDNHQGLQLRAVLALSPPGQLIASGWKALFAALFMECQFLSRLNLTSPFPQFAFA